MNQKIVDFLYTRKLASYFVKRYYYVSYGIVKEVVIIRILTDLGEIKLEGKDASEEMIKEMKKIFESQGYTDDDNIG